MAPLNGPLPALPTLSTPLHLEPTGSGLDRQIEPIVKESGKNGIIAPIAVLRPRADSFEVAKKESLPVFADTSITGATKVFPSFEETSIQSKIPPPDVLTTPEFRKSKSLTRKIKELSGREPRMEGSICVPKEGFSTLDGTLPVSLTAITPLDRIPLVRSTSGNATSIKPISNSLESVPAPLMKERERDLQPLNQHLRESPAKANPIQLNTSNSPAVISKSKPSSSSLQSVKTAVAVPNLTLEKLNSSTASDKSDLDDSLNSFYQHYALPKSLSSTGGKAIAVGDLSGRTSAATGLNNGAAAQVQKPKSKANNVSYNEFVLVENDAVQADTLDKAAENDRILQERLQQAKALSRKDDNGATMHTFSLWKPKNQQQQQGNTAVAITTPSSSAVIGTTASNDESESNGVALVGKYSTRLRGVTAIVEQTSIPVDKESDNKSNLKQYDNSCLLENNISMIKIDAGNGEDYSDDEFVKDEESDSVIDRSVGTIGDGSTLSLNASKNLSNVLRSRIDVAKHFDESYVSNGNASQINGVNGLIDDFDCSYGSLGGRDDSEKVSASFDAPPFVALETSIHHLEDDDMSVGSVEEDVELALELQKASREMEQRGIGTDQVTPTTMMSRSGPAAFLSSIVLPTQVNTAVPVKHAVQDDDSLGQDARRASSGGLIMERSSGMQYEPIRLRSLTSRDMKENQQIRVSNSVNGKSHRQVTMNDQEDVKTSKYKVLKSLRQSSRKQPASSISTTEEGKDQQWKTILSTKVSSISPTMALITPSAGVATADTTDNEKQRDVMNSSPLSELSETDEIPPARPSNSKKSYLEEFDENNNADDQCPSPLKWKKGEVIGEGTFGKVFKGLNEKTGELLAIKQIALADGSNGEVDILRREISVMWDLDHPHIVR